MISVNNVNKYCNDIENIEGYDKAIASEEMYDCHHRLETHTSDGERRTVDLSKKELIALGMYYNRPASELVFMNHTEHRRLHTKGKHPSEDSIRKNREAHKGKCLTEEWKRKIAEGNKGHRVSEESRKKMSEAALNMTEEHKRKIAEAKKGNQAFKGRHHTEESKKKIAEGNKGKQRSEETRRKLVESHKGQTPWNKGKRGFRHWYNNGEISVQAKECPEGFVKGRLRIHH